MCISWQLNKSKGPIQRGKMHISKQHPEVSVKTKAHIQIFQKVREELKLEIVSAVILNFRNQDSNPRTSKAIKY